MSEMNIKRRGFLGMLAAAPAAVPVIAKDAAAKMGLAGHFSSSANHGFSASSVFASQDNDEVSWARDALRDFMSEENVKQRWDIARSHARVLDPDLASMRSVSPSAVYQLQVQRCYDRFTEERKGFFTKVVDDAMKRVVPF